jgi:hypothetical protein
MAKLELTPHQIKELRTLLHFIPFDDFSSLICMLKATFEINDFTDEIQGNSPSRKIKAVAEAKLLRSISIQAQKLSNLIGDLQESNKSSIEYNLRNYLLEQIIEKSPYYEVITKEVLITSDREELESYERNGFEPDIIGLYVNEKICSRSFLDIWTKEAMSCAMVLEDEFSAGYLDDFIMSVSVRWADNVCLPITYSESSLFVKYLSILLDTDSTEKVSKIAYRSKWLNKHKSSLERNMEMANYRKKGEKPPSHLMLDQLSEALQQKQCLEIRDEVEKIKISLRKDKL